MTDLRRQTFSGLRWSAASQAVQQGARFAIAVVLARLLAPEQFGLIGMIYIFTGFAAVLGDLGLGAALVQRRDIDDDHLTAVFWTSIAAGGALTLAFIAGAPLVAAFYDEPALRPLTTVIAFEFVIVSLAVVHRALMNRRMDFRSLSIVETGAAVLSGTLGIAMALMGFGVWSLVAQSLAAAVVSALWMWALSPWRPRLSARRGSLRELFGFSSNLLGFSVLNYWVRNFDDLLVGRVVGSAALGVYTRAYGLMLMPLTQISHVVGRVMFPALSSIQGETARVREIYLRALRAIALITFPMMVGLLVVADEFVLALLGPKWVDLIPVLRIFCLLGIVQSIGVTVGWIYQSQGRTDLMFRWGIAAGAVVMLAFAIGIQWGMIGVAIAYVVASGGVLLYPSFAIPGRLIGLTFADIVRALAPTMVCAGLMGGAVFAVDLLLPGRWPDWAALVSETATGAAVYLALIHLLALPAYRDVRELAGGRWRPPGTQAARFASTAASGQ